VLAELVAVLYQDPTDPVSRVLIPVNQLYRPHLSLTSTGAIWMSYYMELPDPTEVLATASAFFGGEVKITEGGSISEKHTLHTAWLGVSLMVSVRMPREDELAALRKRVADLQALVPAVSE
jgi:hypothetical protein